MSNLLDEYDGGDVREMLRSTKEPTEGEMPLENLVQVPSLEEWLKHENARLKGALEAMEAERDLLRKHVEKLKAELRRPKDFLF